MDRSGAETGHLVVFDRRGDRDWREKVYRRREMHGERQVVAWGCRGAAGSPFGGR